MIQNSQQGYEWLALYQYEGIKIEELLKVCITSFEKKFGYKPDKIYVNQKVELKSYDGIALVGDKQMYSIGIVGLVV